MDAGTLIIRLRAEIANLRANLKRATNDVKSFAVSVKTQMASATRAMNRFAKKTMRNMARSVKRYAKIAAASLVAIGLASVKMAADVREANNFFAESFKSASREARAWANEFGQSLYLNRAKVREYMVTFNEMLQGMGLGREEALKMSKNFTQMTYDLASFRNLSMEESFNKITSAIAGMSRPMLNLGYDISETALKEEAFRLGINKSVEDMTQAEKVMLRYSRMTRVLGNAHGDMARTINEAANVFRGIWENLIEIGQKVGEVILKRIHEPAKQLRDFLAQNQDQITAYFEAVLTNLINIASYMKSDFTGAMRTAGEILLEIFKGVFSSIYIAAEKTFTSVGKNAPGWISKGLKAAAAAIVADDTLEKEIEKQAQIIYRKKSGEARAFKGFAVAGIMGGAVGQYQPQNRVLYEQILEQQRSLVMGAQAGMTTGLSIEETVGEEWKKRLENIKSIVEKAQETGGLQIVTPDQVQAIHTGETALESFKEQINLIKDAFSGVKTEVETLTPVIEETANDWSSMWEKASSGIAGAMQSAFTTIVTDASNAKDAVTSMMSSIAESISQAMFQQYLLPQIFKGVNSLFGTALTVPGASTTTQTGSFETTGQSHGGIVYAARGAFVPRGTDTVPAMLTPGEGVLDRDTTSRLRSILNVPQKMEQSSPTNVIQIQAIDAQSTLQFFAKNRTALGSMFGLNRQLNSPGTRS